MPHSVRQLQHDAPNTIACLNRLDVASIAASPPMWLRAEMGFASRPTGSHRRTRLGTAQQRATPVVAGTLAQALAASLARTYVPIAQLRAGPGTNPVQRRAYRHPRALDSTERLIKRRSRTPTPRHHLAPLLGTARRQMTSGQMTNDPRPPHARSVAIIMYHRQARTPHSRGMGFLVMTVRTIEPPRLRPSRLFCPESK